MTHLAQLNKVPQHVVGRTDTSEMRERQEKMEMALRGAAPGTTEQQPTRKKMGNGATGPTKPSMGDGVPPTSKASSSRASARTSRTM